MNNLERDAALEQLISKRKNSHRYVTNSKCRDMFSETRKIIALLQLENGHESDFTNYMNNYLFIQKKYFKTHYLRIQKEITVLKNHFDRGFDIKDNDVLPPKIKQKIAFNLSLEFEKVNHSVDLDHTRKSIIYSCKNYHLIIEEKNREILRLEKIKDSLPSLEFFICDDRFTINKTLLMKELEELVLFYYHVLRYKTRHNKNDKWFKKFENEFKVISLYEDLGYQLNYLTKEQIQKQFNLEKGINARDHILKIIAQEIGCSISFVRKTLDNLRADGRKTLISNKDIQAHLKS